MTDKKPIESEIKDGKIIESFSKKGSKHTGEVIIKRGHYDSLKLYDVSDSELEILENGSPNSIYLNISIFLLSAGLSFSITLLTTDLSKEIIKFNIFFIICICSSIIGIILFIVWFRNKNDFQKTIKKIKNRMND